MAVVYVDVIFVLNLIIDYLLLYMTGKMLKSGTSKIIIGCGAVIGAFYTVLMLCVDYGFFSSLPCKLLFSALLVRITFGKMRFKGFLRAMVMFYFVNFAFCGGIYASASMLGMSDKLLTFGIFTFYSVISYIILTLVARHRRSVIAKQKVKLVISLNSLEKEIDCIVDTGNSLCTPFSGKPVIVAEKNELEGLLPVNFPQSQEVKPVLIPFRSVGCDKGIIYGFAPDSAYLVHKGKRKKVQKVVIGIYEGNLSTDGNYKGLVNPSLIA